VVVIKRLGVLSVAKIYGAMGVLVGLLVGVCVSAVSALWGTRMAEESSGVTAFGAGLGLAAIVVVPIFYGVFTFISGLIGGWFYNLIAGMVGGIEIETS
jgi:threonine/homoserine efflux transporter RhtA